MYRTDRSPEQSENCPILFFPHPNECYIVFTRMFTDNTPKQPYFLTAPIV